MYRVIGKTYTSVRNLVPVSDQTLLTEMDNCADNHWFGAKFHTFHLDGLESTVLPFLDEYNSQENIPICSGETTYTTGNGETVILIIGQESYSGKRINKSPIT